MSMWKLIAVFVAIALTVGAVAYGLERVAAWLYEDEDIGE